MKVKNKKIKKVAEARNFVVNNPIKRFSNKDK